jgi:tRNA1(Val) A37 N6-methylase TrmN6
VAVSDRHQYWLGKQKELETKIKTMKAKVSKAQEKEKAEIATKLAELDKFAKEVESGERSLNFFQYHLHFRDVFESKGGFDVVIGNPPYVFARNSQDKGFTDEDKKYFYENFELAEYQVNLYPLFIEKGCSLLRKKGHFAYITPNNWMTINTNKKVVTVQGGVSSSQWY